MDRGRFEDQPRRPNREPNPDKQFEKRRMERETAARRKANQPFQGWGLGPRLRAATLGVLPRVATRGRIAAYRSLAYGWKGRMVSLWIRTKQADRVLNKPQWRVYVGVATDLPGALLRLAGYALVWNLLALLFVSRYAIGRTWARLTRVVDGLEWLVVGTVRLADRVWSATIGRVVDR